MTFSTILCLFDRAGVLLGGGRSSGNLHLLSRAALQREESLSANALSINAGLSKQERQRARCPSI